MNDLRAVIGEFLLIAALVRLGGFPTLRLELLGGLDEGGFVIGAQVAQRFVADDEVPHLEMGVGGDVGLCHVAERRVVAFGAGSDDTVDDAGLNGRERF